MGEWGDIDRQECGILDQLGVWPLNSKNACPDARLLLAAEEGVLPAEQAAEIITHVKTCPACKMLVSELRAVEPEITPADAARIHQKVVAAAAARPSGFFQSFLRPIPIAAFSAAVVLLVVLIVFKPGSQPRNAAPTSANSAQMQAPNSVVASAFELKKAPVQLSASEIGLWRGEGANTAAADKLRQGLEAYSASKYTEAVQQLDRYLRSHPRSQEAFFYEGVSELFLGINRDAATSLEKARSSSGSLQHSEIEWYLAIAYLRTNNEDKAIPLLTKICNSQSSYRDDACRGLAELQTKTNATKAP